MSRKSIRYVNTMKHTAIKMLQVSAAYFALGSAQVPAASHLNGLAGRPPLTNSRLAAGAWPMIVLPLPVQRKQAAQDSEHSVHMEVCAEEVIT